jgi:hypothetical protein
VETEKACDNEPKDACKYVGCNDEVSCSVVNVLLAEYSSNDSIRCKNYKDAGQWSIEQHIDKVLVVAKADAVRHPWTVVVHLQDALVALRAVVTSVWLGSQTSLAHSYTAVLLSLDALFHNRSWLNEKRRLFWIIFQLVKGACHWFYVFVIKVTGLLWVFLVFFYLVVCELPES